MIKNNIQNTKSSEDFIKQVVTASTKECFGVIGIARKNGACRMLRLLFGYKDATGVKISCDEEGKLIIDVYIIVAFGVRVLAVAENLISTIKYNVERQTDKKVKKINVYVRNLRA